jgi:hypothetical protein
MTQVQDAVSFVAPLGGWGGSLLYLNLYRTS